MDLASFLEALPAAQLDSVYASQVQASVCSRPGQLQTRSNAAVMVAASRLLSPTSQQMVISIWHAAGRMQQNPSAAPQQQLLPSQ
jgi:hypothetical protein